MRLTVKYSETKKKSVLILILETLWMSNLSRQELALLYGVHSDSLAGWIAGTHEPREDTIERIKKIHHSEWLKLENLLNAPYSV